MTKLMQTIVTGPAYDGAWIQTKVSVLNHLPYCSSCHNVTHSMNVLASWLTCQIPTWLTNFKLLFFLGKIKADPFPYSNCTSVFLFCYPELHYTFGFFDKLTANCFINLFVFNLYIIPLWEFSLNPSLASFTTSFFLSVQTGLYKARQTGLHLYEGHEASTYAELVGRHLFIVHTLGSPDMVLISAKTFNSSSLQNHSCSLACRFS